jgi:hypothetical protein
MIKPNSIVSKMIGVTALVLNSVPALSYAQNAPAVAKPWSQLTTSELIAAAPADAWQALDPAQTLYLDFEPTPARDPCVL